MDFGITDILVTLIGGSVIGILGKLVAPGDRDNIALWLTILCGTGGVALGTLLYSATGLEDDPNGFDFWRHLGQIGVAAVLVGVACGITGRRRLRA